MRMMICLLFLVLACREKSTSSGSGQTEAKAPVISESPATPGTPVTDVTMTEEFMTLINDHRVTLGLDPLTSVTGLEEISTYHSSNMASGSVAFGHTGFSERCALGRSVLGGGNLCAENVAMGQKTVQAAFTAWMNSSGHRANIENARVTHTGFGFAKSSSGVWYWTQIFLEKN